MNCSRCGSSIPEENPGCPNCGLPRFAQFNPPPPVPSGPEPVRSYIIPSLILMVCCCTPFGLVAVIFSAMSMSKQASGDIAGAREAASKARLFCWLGFIVGVIVDIIIFFVYGASSFLETLQRTAG